MNQASHRTAGGATLPSAAQVDPAVVAFASLVEARKCRDSRSASRLQRELKDLGWSVLAVEPRGQGVAS